MKLVAATNVLLRAVVADDPAQADAAVNALEEAEVVAVGPPTPRDGREQRLRKTVFAQSSGFAALHANRRLH